jgi:hypothetical protein
MTLYGKCLSHERKGEVFHILDPSPIEHGQFCDLGAVPHVFETKEKHHRHPIYA